MVRPTRSTGMLALVILAIGHAPLDVSARCAEPADRSRVAVQSLAYFRGEWGCAGRFVGNGAAIRSRESFAATLDGRWLRMRHADDPPHTFRAVEMWGYDAGSARFVALAFDNAGGVRRYVSTGWQGDALNWQSEAAPSGHDRFMFQREGRDAYRVSYQRHADDARWRTIDVLECRRE